MKNKTFKNFEIITPKQTSNGCMSKPMIAVNASMMDIVTLKEFREEILQLIPLMEDIEKAVNNLNKYVG